MKLQRIISVNPSKNYEIIGEVDSSTSSQIDHKVQLAREAQKDWALLSIKERIIYLEKVYQALFRRKDEIRDIASKEMGMPRSIADIIDIEVGFKYMRGYLDYAEKWLEPEITFENNSEIHYLTFEPKGVVGASVPWNFPFTIFVWSVIQNLIVGNTVVFKHSEECILTGKLLETIVKSTDLSDGVFHEVYGDGATTGEYLLNSNVDLIWFTGSTGVGKHIYQVAAKKFVPVILELGGSSPGIVFQDANLDIAIKSIYSYRFYNSGQSCDALKRLIVHESIFDDTVQRLKNLIETKSIGCAQDTQTDIGPLAAERQLISLEKQVQDALDKNARVIIGAKRPDNLQGAYYEPTILTNISFDMKVWKEEVFGPVLPIVPFKTEQEAISLANDTIYGLGGYVYTQDIERAMRISKALKTGNINVNNADYNIPENPFGGYKYSGMAREHGKIGLRDLCNIKIIATKK